MKLDGHEVMPVDLSAAITWSASFAIKEAYQAGVLSDADAEHLLTRMNTILGWLRGGKIVAFNEATGLFEPRDIPTEDADPDVLVIKGASA